MRVRTTARTIALLLVAVAAGACDVVGGGDELGGGLDDELQVVVEEAVRAATAGTLVRVETAEGEVELTAGYSDLRTRTPLSAGEAFRVASITKLFTAAVVLQLAEEGALDLDAPVAAAVPQRAADLEFGHELTPRQLLSHTSGLPDYVGFDREAGRFPPGEVPAFLSDLLGSAVVEDGVVSRSCEEDEHLATYAHASGDAAFEPGTDRSYSNTGYVLLGEAIEAVTGLRLEEVYRQRLLEPLGLEGTWLACAEEPETELARGYHPPGALGLALPGQGSDPLDVTELKETYWAAGGLASTAEDLARFARALFGGDLFDDAATLESMLEPVEGAAYGLGVELSEEGAVGHGGLAAGYRTALRYYASDGAVVVVLVNESTAAPLAPIEAAVRSLLDRRAES